VLKRLLNDVGTEPPKERVKLVIVRITSGGFLVVKSDESGGLSAS
jgi:hypothetical protein